MAEAALMLSLAGTAVTAGATLAGGDAAQASADYTAKQIDQNATAEIAAGQRRMFERQRATRAAIATSRVRAAASGVDPGSGSALDNERELAERGEYQSLMELFGGQNEATGLMNKAAGVRYEGEMKRQGSQLAALGTLASGLGSSLGQAGKVYFPTTGRRAA